MRRRRRRRIIRISLLSAAVLLVALAISLYFWNQTYLILGGDVVRQDIMQLDLSSQSLPEIKKLAKLQQLQTLDLRDTGLTEAQYLELKALLPQCRILWSVPFQGGYLSSDNTSLTVTRLTAEDVALLQYLEQLQTVDASACYDYDAILALKQTRPGVSVEHHVVLSGIPYPLTVTALEVEHADPKEMTAVLPHLTELKEVSLTGNLPSNEQILQWKNTYPDVTFIWEFEVCGVSATSLDRELILNDIPMESTAEVEKALDYFYNLEKVEMCKCGIPSEEMDALGKRHPQTRFIWTVYAGRCELRTDVTTFMPWKFGYRNKGFHDGLTAELKYCTDIICMDLGHMAISDYSFLNYMPNMQYLLLCETTGTDFSFLKNMPELKYLEVFGTPFNDFELLTGLTKLEDVNLSYCFPPTYEPLTRMPWIKNVWLIGPYARIPYSERMLLINELPDTYIQFSGKGSASGRWRNLPNYYAMRDLLGMPYYPPDPE